MCMRLDACRPEQEDKTPIYVGLKERSLACLREIFRLGVRVPAEQEVRLFPSLS